MVRELRVLAARHTDLIDVPVAIPVTIYRHHPLIIINADTSTAFAQMAQEQPEKIVRQMGLLSIGRCIQ